VALLEGAAYPVDMPPGLDQLACPSCGGLEFWEEIRHTTARLGVMLRGVDGLRFERPDNQDDGEEEEWWEPTYLCADCGQTYVHGTQGSSVRPRDL
jgi:hypothetical protein